MVTTHFVLYRPILPPRTILSGYHFKFPFCTIFVVMDSRKKEDMIKIACIGDSITWGFTIIRRSKYSYPAVLGELLNSESQEFEVNNYGYNDSTARMDSEVPYVKKRVFTNAQKFLPDIAIIMLGSNDTKRINWDPEKFREGYSKIVDTFTELGAKVYLMTPPPILNKIEIKEGVEISRIDPSIISLNDQTLDEGVIPIIKELAREKGLPVIDINSAIGEVEQFNDGIHPNREGAEIIARTVYERLSKDLNL